MSPKATAALAISSRPATQRTTARCVNCEKHAFVARGETDEAPLARELFVRHKPKLVLLGLTLRGGDGFHLIFSFIGRGFSVSELAAELHVSVKTIETHQMRMKEKLALHSAAELRQKAREWLAKSAVNRIREDPESE